MQYLLLAAGIIAADQILKYLVVTFVGIGNQIPLIDNLFYIHCIQNNGIATGMLAGRQSLVIAVTAVIMTAIVIYIGRRRKKGSRAELSLLTLIVAGGVANLIDRIRLNYVVDYIDVRVWPYIFNFADICVVIGCICLFFYVFFDSKGK